jgi:hypothetical protein
MRVIQCLPSAPGPWEGPNQLGSSLSWGAGLAVQKPQSIEGLAEKFHFPGKWLHVSVFF